MSRIIPQQGTVVDLGSALQVLFKKFGIRVKWVYSDDPAEFAAAIDENTKAIYVESIGNPKYNVSPLDEIAKVSILMFPLSDTRSQVGV